MSKVFLALIDGMRPDSLTSCSHPFFRELLQTSRYSMNMRTIMPSVTLPCHMSLFHSVSAERHGILTNTYVPQVRPVNGICEHLAASGKRCAFFYTWEPLKDLSRPLALSRANYYSGRLYTYAKADRMVTEDAERMLQSGDTPDFIFFYQCRADEDGHKYGWMSEQYIQAVSDSLDNIQHVAKQLPSDYAFILTADHGGHDRSHGTDSAEDMTTPFFLRHNSITPGEINGTPGILDIAPTVASCLGLLPDPDWEGNSLL
ncbi:MAG: alkaline phosphatase family protein [Lentisphaeria bacterium]|nr:alkaline phosphatase family protein [Lentisphaeria bacterium]